MNNHGWLFHVKKRREHGKSGNGEGKQKSAETHRKELLWIAEVFIIFVLLKREESLPFIQREREESLG